MLYVAQIDAPNRAMWGNTHSLELLLPAKIHTIHGYLVNAVLGSNTRLKRCYSTKFIMNNDQIANQEIYMVRLPDDSVITTSDQQIAEAAENEILFTYNEPATVQDIEEQPISSQIGVVSLSLNNTQIIADSIPLCVTQHLNKQGIVPNTITLPKPEKVQGGSFLRIIIEEQQLSPVLTKKEWSELSFGQKEKYYGNATTEPTNNYTAKIYLNYD